ncbi:hypothetical protein AAFF_G00437600 [Aldrovandia affinis]|uniref:HTH CENPB-type domain-containing protein n=1 Tax=Aldrovandia affinis TaxID=143900 RepID=A0AAD7WIP9_9TELE|nr:hypothetical protein AAFF_G00437600 [Aldrovandia affinis]
MAPNKKYDVKFKLEVIKYSEQNSAEATARHFGIDPKRVRQWLGQKEKLFNVPPSEHRQRARLQGGGRKKVSEELEFKLSQWVLTMRVKLFRVSRKMIKMKAKELYTTVSDHGGSDFRASSGWLDKFLLRNGFTGRRCSTVAQKDARHFTEKLVSYVHYVTQTVAKKQIAEDDIIAMGETAVWFDMVGSTKVDARSARSVPLKTTGHEKSYLTVVLAAKGDGTKLKPYVVFKRAARDVKAMQDINGALVASSTNGCMNDRLTVDWLQRVVGKFSFTPRMLVWDSYRCHISSATKEELKHDYNIVTAVIPDGCTNHIQAPNLMWSQPFNANLHESYDNWMAGDADKEYTAGGNVRPPLRHLLVDWVLSAWGKLDGELVKRSFKVCGLTVAPDGSEDHLIHCFKEGEPCSSGRELLSQARQQSLKLETTREMEEDEEELERNELVVDDDNSSLHDRLSTLHPALSLEDGCLLNQISNQNLLHSESFKWMSCHHHQEEKFRAVCGV